jgi:hypothetical protein
MKTFKGKAIYNPPGKQAQDSLPDHIKATMKAVLKIVEKSRGRTAPILTGLAIIITKKLNGKNY